MKLALLRALSQIIIEDSRKQIEGFSIKHYSGKPRSSNSKKVKPKNKPNIKYFSSKPIKSKAVKVFRNKSNI